MSRMPLVLDALEFVDQSLLLSGVPELALSRPAVGKYREGYGPYGVVCQSPLRGGVARGRCPAERTAYPSQYYSLTHTRVKDSRCGYEIEVHYLLHRLNSKEVSKTGRGGLNQVKRTSTMYWKTAMVAVRTSLSQAYGHGRVQCSRAVRALNQRTRQS
jgi:hypothetical protein